MSTRTPTRPHVWMALALALAACGTSEEPSTSKGNVVGAGGQSGGAGQSGAQSSSGGSSSASGGAGQGGSPSGGSAQGGTSAGGQATGTMCGIESCTGARQCCPSTGKCYSPDFEGCSKITCTVTSNDTGGGAGAANCCTNGLLHCASNDLCYHAACVGCCP